MANARRGARDYWYALGGGILVLGYAAASPFFGTSSDRVQGKRNPAAAASSSSGPRGPGGIFFIPSFRGGK